VQEQAGKQSAVVGLKLTVVLPLFRAKLEERAEKRRFSAVFWRFDPTLFTSGDTEESKTPLSDSLHVRSSRGKRELTFSVNHTHDRNLKAIDEERIQVNSP
jgi:hypothetical protein